jgi:hypothetical protein
MQLARTSTEGHPIVNSDLSHLNGAALIDAQGMEVPITEEMIRQALESMEASWVNFYQETAVNSLSAVAA